MPARLFAPFLIRLATLGRAPAPARVPAVHTRNQRVERARKAMLKLLEDSNVDGAHTLRRRIRLADGLDQLWFLRCDVVATVSQAHGESVAHQRVQQLDPLFDRAR